MCQIDGILSALFFEMAENPSFATKCSDPTISRLLQSLVASKDQKSLCEARGEFLIASADKIAGYVNMDGNIVTIDTYRNDVDLITQLFGPIIEVNYLNKCSNATYKSSNNSWTSSAAVPLVNVK